VAISVILVQMVDCATSRSHRLGSAIGKAVVAPLPSGGEVERNLTNN